jgi:uncharacterized OB-fold protein
LKEAPYVVAFVELEEGPHLMSTVVDIPREQLRCDMPLEVAFVPAREGTWLPVFSERHDA